MSQLVLQRVYFPVISLGYGRRLGVWVRGCKRDCLGCISSEMRQYEGNPIDVEEIINALPDGFTADGLTISGGEPFDQAEGIAELVRWFIRNISSDVLIYTGYTEQELRNRKDKATDYLLAHIAVLVDGPYLEHANDGIGLRGSANQQIIIYRFPERYRNAGQWTRQVQFVDNGESLIQIGIPPLKTKKL